MKTGTKCGYKLAPNTQYVITAIDEEKKIAFITAQRLESFPVPLSELEPVQEWPKTWEELIEVGGFTLSSGCVIEKHKKTDKEFYQSLFSTHQQAESALAMAQLSQLHKAIVGDWEADWSYGNQGNWCVHRDGNKLQVYWFSTIFHYFPFQTEEQAEFSLLHHRELWEKFYMIKK